MKTYVIGDVHGRRTQLRRLIELLPRDPATDSLVLLGDLIDRCEDAPGTVDDVLRLQQSVKRGEAPVIVLRGNHEQMILDFIDLGAPLWLHQAVGSACTFQQYVGHGLRIESVPDMARTRRELAAAIPPAHIEFFRQLPLYHEDEFAIYVHAGLHEGKHPRETTSHHLLWTREPDFYKHYDGKPCVFGHTPTPLLPIWGRLGRHGIYIGHHAIGIDTGYNVNCPLTCLQLPDFRLYQAFPDGRTATHHLTNFIPQPFRPPRQASSIRSDINPAAAARETRER